jgi:hypothetical protein
MKSHLPILATLLLLLASVCPAAAGREPYEFAGIITKLNARYITIKSPRTTEVFDIQTAGICGWPSRKRIPEVFKIGDRVIVYHFYETTAQGLISVLNVFFADERKVRAFQQSHRSSANPSR